MSASIRGPSTANAEVAPPSALTRRRSRLGSTCSSLASARSEVSSIPAIEPEARGPQADRDRDRLGVVEQQRRQLAAGAEPVAAGDPRRGLDRVAERPQLVDVAADRAGPDLESIGELLPGPLAPKLQQREQREQAGGRLDHLSVQVATNCGLKLT